MRNVHALLAIVLLVGSPTEASAATSLSADVAPVRAGGARGPKALPALRFSVLGDFGTGTASQTSVAQRMCRWRRSHPFDLVVTTGDNIYPNGDQAYFEANFFEPYACLLDNGVRFRATLGNHDVVTEDGRPELDEPAFGMPRRNYVFRRTGVRFVMVDSNAVKRKWLRRATRAESSDRWTIVAFHHPVYSPGKHGSTSGFRPWMPRLFQRRGVDIVLNGHDHLYAVTKPLKRISYVVTGGGGAGLYDCHDHWFSSVCRSRYHFLHVRAGERIRVRAVPARGRPFHTFSTKGKD